MEKIAEEYPIYQWKKNKGYPTVDHRNAALAHGLSPYHRKTFTISQPQLALFSEIKG
jgi:ribonuclease HII